MKICSGATRPARLGLGDAPEAVRHRGPVGEGRGRRAVADQRRELERRVDQAEDRAQVRAAGTDQLQAVRLGRGERALVRQHDARRERLQLERREEPPALVALPLYVEALRVDEERRLGIGREPAAPLEVEEQLGRGVVGLVALRQDQVDRVGRARRGEALALARVDDVVRRCDQLAERAGLVGVAQRAEGTDQCHGIAPQTFGFSARRRTSSTAARGIAPSRSTRSGGPGSIRVDGAPEIGPSSM
jgi:hypothetical protein